MEDIEVKRFKTLLDRNPETFRNFPEEARGNKEIAGYALDKNPFNMWYLPIGLTGDREYVKNVLAAYPTFAVNKMSPKLQKDSEMLRFAMERNEIFGPRDLEHICKHCPDKTKLIEDAFERLDASPYYDNVDKRVGRAVAANLLGIDESVEVVEKDPMAYSYMTGEMKENIHVALAALEGDPSLADTVPPKLQTVEFYTQAALNNLNVLPNVPGRMYGSVVEATKKALGREIDTQSLTGFGKAPVLEPTKKHEVSKAKTVDPMNFEFDTDVLEKESNFVEQQWKETRNDYAEKKDTRTRQGGDCYEYER